MSLPANLFVDTPEMEDSSLHRLGNDPETWPEDIISKFKERIPAASGLSMMVKFMKKDEESGAATGSITVHSADKAAIIPVIIKDFMMYPLDVMIAKQKLLPLNPDYFGTVFSSDKLFAKLEEFPTFGGLGRFEDANLWNSIYPPSLGRYAYASSGTYDILNTIADTIDGSEFKKFLQDRSNEKIAARLLSGPHKDVVVKIANLQPVNMNEFRQGVENLIPRTVNVLKYEGPNKYTLLSNSDSVFHPALTTMTRKDVHAFMSQLSDHVEDDINDVDQNGEKLLTMPKPKNDVILAQEDMEIPEEAREYDHYSVKTLSTGVSVEGVVIPKVIDFDMKVTGQRLFVGKTLSNYQERIYGVRLKNSRFQPVTGEPRVGQTGCFLYQPDKSHGIATVPVTITSLVDDCGEVHIRATDLAGGPIRIKICSAGSHELQRIAPIGPRSYMVPSQMKWLPLEGFTDVSNSEYDYSVKQAAERLTDRPVTLISTGYDQYAMRGVQKYASALAWDATNLQRSQTIFLLASLGCPQEKIAKVLKQASRTGKSEVHNLSFPPLASEKIAKARPLAQHLYKQALSLRSNLTKHASYLENGQTVDALLSLNFVTPSNISKFVNKIPNLKSAISNLASILIGSRLGIKEVPEQSVSEAITRLVEVVDGLEKLKAVQTVGA